MTISVVNVHFNSWKNAKFVLRQNRYMNNGKRNKNESALEMPVLRHRGSRLTFAFLLAWDFFLKCYVASANKDVDLWMPTSNSMRL